MKGALVVNGFLNGDKFYGIYQLLVNAFKTRGVQLDIVKSSDVNGKEDFLTLPDFVMFWDKDYYLAEKLEKHVFALQSRCTPLHLGQMALNLLLSSQLFGG